MTFQITMPEMSESINSGVIAQWLVKEKQHFAEGDILLEVETDKVTVEIPAPYSGYLREIRAKNGQEIKIGEVLAIGEKATKPSTDTLKQIKNTQGNQSNAVLSPAVRQLAVVYDLSQSDLSKITGTGKSDRITKSDIMRYVASSQRSSENNNNNNNNTNQPLVVNMKTENTSSANASEDEVVSMTPIRKRIAERLVQAQQQAAILTTFNEIDMSNIISLRTKYKQAFSEKYAVHLGYMSIFIKIVCEVLKEIPALNAKIQGDKIVYHKNYHLGVAVGGPRGLVVPVIFHAEKLSHAQIEKTILEKITAIKNGSIKLADLEGGTFTISNGGVYGSMLSTPILNPPQVGILGLHNIVKRPVVTTDSATQQDQVEIRPIMYTALSYDHRLIDGKEAVTFLRRVKELAEDPQRIWITL